MPGSGWDSLWDGDSLTDLSNNGSATDGRLDDVVIRLLKPLPWLGQETNPSPEVLFNAMGQEYFPSTVGYHDVRQASTADLIRQIGTGGISLLNNIGGLPVKNSQRIAVPVSLTKIERPSPCPSIDPLYASSTHHSVPHPSSPTSSNSDIISSSTTSFPSFGHHTGLQRTEISP